MSLFSVFKTSKEKEAAGFWFADTGVVNDDGSTPAFLLARANRQNPAFASATEQVGKKFKRQLDNDLMTTDKALEINKALFLDTILLDWKDLWLPDDSDPDGPEKLVPYSRENADTLFALLPDLYDLLEAEARKASNFREAETEKIGKN